MDLACLRTYEDRLMYILTRISRGEKSVYPAGWGKASQFAFAWPVADVCLYELDALPVFSPGERHSQRAGPAANALLMVLAGVVWMHEAFRIARPHDPARTRITRPPPYGQCASRVWIRAHTWSIISLCVQLARNSICLRVWPTSQDSIARGIVVTDGVQARCFLAGPAHSYLPGVRGLRLG